MKLELKKFDPSTIKSDSVIVFIGKRNMFGCVRIPAVVYP